MRAATWMTALTLAIGITAVGTLVGCDDRIRQCNALIEVINKEQAPLKSATGSNPAQLKKLAAMLDNVAEKVGAVELKSQELIGFRDDYAEMATELGKASRDTAAAVESNDPKKAAEAAKAMKSFGPREVALVENINKYCQVTN